MTQRHVAVLGAGIVGVSCALHLKRRGFQVTLVDRREPGSETSYGNSGIISRASIAPLSQPGLWRKLPRYLANRDRGVRFAPGSARREAGWFLRFLANTTPTTFRANAQSLDALLRHALPEHEALLGADSSLLRYGGWLHLFRTEAGFAATAAVRALWYRYGVAFRVLDAEAIQELEPHLEPVFRRGIWLKDLVSVSNPQQICQAIFERFTAEGGTWRQDEIRSLRMESGPAGPVRVEFADGELQAEQAVVALGPWSLPLIAPLGYRLPVIHERGYHMHFAPRGNAKLERPCFDAEGAYLVTPMDAGLRLTTGIEFSAPDAPPSPVQFEAVLPMARDTFPLADKVDPEPWLGRRPGTPDSLPVVGRAPHHPNLWFAFGHASIGFTLGPITGRIVAEMMSGEGPLVDPAPYAAERFRRWSPGRPARAEA